MADIIWTGGGSEIGSKCIVALGSYSNKKIKKRVLIFDNLAQFVELLE